MSRRRFVCKVKILGLNVVLKVSQAAYPPPWCTISWAARLMS